jgi:hypothetical protein
MYLKFIILLGILRESYGYIRAFYPNFFKHYPCKPLYFDENTKSLLPDLSQTTFPHIEPAVYDLIVFGSGPGGESVAVHAARLGNFYIRIMSTLM